jgi:hypothetical protein
MAYFYFNTSLSAKFILKKKTLKSNDLHFSHLRIRTFLLGRKEKALLVTHLILVTIFTQIPNASFFLQNLCIKNPDVHLM